MAKFVIERFVSVPVRIELEADSIDDAIQKHFEYGRWDCFDYADSADYYYTINQINGKSEFQEERDLVYVENVDTGDAVSLPLSACMPE